MITETYPARYRDRFGEIATTIYNNGKKLRIMLRGVEFTGETLDDWEPNASVDVIQLQQFTFNHSELCEFVLEFEIPLLLFSQTERFRGTLRVHLTLGSPAPNGGVDREIIHLQLEAMNTSFSSQGKSGWFEDELLDIHRQLPKEIVMQTCICCAFSDYSPLGHGLFGDLACFRDNKSGYLAVKTKQDLFALWNTQTEMVQETYHCQEFTRRKPGTGYRG